MAKVALLIGVSEYQPGLSLLPGAVKDIEAMQRVLQHPEMGGFDQVKTLTNPDPLLMQGEIECLFSDRSKEDLVLLFFSGHGVKDDRGKLYFATRITRKSPKGELLRSTAVPSSFVHEIMSNSRSKRQVVLLDCCFSGAFAEGMTAKDDGVVDVQTQLGGEGRAVLTSSTATQYSFEQEESDLSIYTRYIVEGIETGTADLNNDGSISIDELHEYACKKVQEASPAMKPKIYAAEEGFKIRLAKVAAVDPKLIYRKEVERCVIQGDISSIGRRILEGVRESLKLSPESASLIEDEVLSPYRERQRKLQRYEEAFVEAVQQQYPLWDTTYQELQRYRQTLGLREADVLPIEDSVVARRTDSKTETQYTDIPQLKPTASSPVNRQEPAERVALPQSSGNSTESSPSRSKPVSSPANSTKVSPRASQILQWKVLIGMGMGVAAVTTLVMQYSSKSPSTSPIVPFSSQATLNTSDLKPIPAGKKESVSVYGSWQCTCEGEKGTGVCPKTAEHEIKSYGGFEKGSQPFRSRGWVCVRQ